MEILNKDAEFDVVGMGSALLDFTVQVKDADLAALGLAKGGMQLIDEARSKEILAGLEGKPMEVTPGGSAANTLAGVSNLGGSGIFMGAVGKDKNGDRYIADTERTGVRADLGRHDRITGHAITFITPDSERTFATHLGASQQFNKSDINEEHLRRSRILHIEGYFFEDPVLREACMSALEMAKRHRVLVSVDLSDPGLIGRIHDTFKVILPDYVDIVFANEEEARAFTGREKEEALDDLSALCGYAVVKLGAAGSLIKKQGVLYRVTAVRTSVVNTNGAGDMYAAGVLYGIASGFSPERSGRIGSHVSSKVVAQVGARLPEKISVDELA